MRQRINWQLCVLTNNSNGGLRALFQRDVPLVEEVQLVLLDEVLVLCEFDRHLEGEEELVFLEQTCERRETKRKN